ncbi:MAG: ErfK/YbiS/YcfS/YnhG family protein [Thermoleophilia bacterium]|nr:ErfK/YbiS/YcfS/YnhG family protein [Thermoleophilia bacterium]
MRLTSPGPRVLLAAAAAITLACLTPALTAHPSRAATTAAPTAPVVANGACVHPLKPTALRPVSYKFATRTNIWRARLVFGTVAPTSLPGAGRSVGMLSAVTLHTGRAAGYLVLDARQVGSSCYLLLRMPAVGTTSNYRVGWVDRDLVVATRTLWQIEIDRSERMVRLYRAGHRMLAQPVVIGRTAYPTPLAPASKPFAMYDAVAGRPSDFTGSWELATTAHNEIDSTLGRVGIHGRGGASLADPLGSASSHGCVRANNSTVNRIVRLIGLPNMFGVPVVITQ